MPTYRTSLSRGFLLVGSTPALVLLPFAWTLVTWLILQVSGYIGAPLLLAQSVALPPLSVSSDFQTALVTFGQPTGIYVMLPFLLVRAVIIAVLAGLIVEGFERGTVSLDGARRGVRALPLVLSGVVLSLLSVIMLVYASLLGPGLGTLLQVLVPAVALWVLGFVPFAAVDERRSLPVTLTRSYYGARTPGGRQFLFSMLYLLLLTVLQAFTPGAETTANPSLATWAFILAIDYVHVGFFAAYGYRWLVIAPSVAAPVPASRRRGR
ncbi:MAG TPA: hypothetical protein VGR41_06270 [Actinomycetota bacterium]|jgi:hypothetical protein|nr:hypothetical protein [Actinomycetota bacterium]